MWNELKERFLKFEALHGLYWIPSGVAGIYTILFHMEFIFHVMGIWLCIFLILEGLYKLLYNPAKKKAAISRKADKYMKPKPPAGSA